MRLFYHRDSVRSHDEAAPTRRGNRVARAIGFTVVPVLAIASVAFAAYRLISHDVPRTNSEHRLNLHLYAPFGSLAMTSGAPDGTVARLEMQADESAEDPQIYLRYGVTQSGQGNLRVSIGDDEGQLQSKSLASAAAWRATSNIALVNANYISTDAGGGYTYGYSQWSTELPSAPQRSELVRNADAAGWIAQPPSPPQNDATYKSRLYLPTDLPLAINAQLGFGETYLDFTNIPVERAYIETGASRSHIVFNAPNSSRMSALSVSAGVGECTIDGLCNSNAAKFDFSGGIGFYTLGFAGTLTNNLDASVSVGLGKVSINIPPQAGRVQVFFDDNLFSGYTFSGLAIRRSGYATSVGFDHSTAPILTLRLSSGMGKMNVTYR